MTMRPSWDDYFMKIAEDAATRSTCDRALVVHPAGWSIVMTLVT
jgi:hypothetical protein